MGPLGRSRLVSCTRRGCCPEAQLDPAEGMEAEKHGGPEKQGQRDASVAMRAPVGQEAHA